MKRKKKRIPESIRLELCRLLGVCSVVAQFCPNFCAFRNSKGCDFQDGEWWLGHLDIVGSTSEVVGFLVVKLGLLVRRSGPMAVCGRGINLVDVQLARCRLLTERSTVLGRG